MRLGVSIAVAIATLVTLQGIAQADTVTFSTSGPGEEGGTLSASATFELVNEYLIVVLTNTAQNGARIPSDVLGSLYFDIAGNPSLIPVSAILTPGSVVLNASQPAGGNVGGEWGLGSALSGAPGNAYYGISANGYGLFGNPNFNGPQLDNPLALNGMTYGIVSGIAGNANPVVRSGVFISDSVTFTLALDQAALEDFSLGDISNVSFQYGTSLEQPNIHVPEPASMTLLGIGLGLMAVRHLRRRFGQNQPE